jgi:hypothetical protein
MRFTLCDEKGKIQRSWNTIAIGELPMAVQIQHRQRYASKSNVRPSPDDRRLLTKGSSVVAHVPEVAIDGSVGGDDCSVLAPTQSTI